jgi:hypothetical protein
VNAADYYEARIREMDAEMDAMQLAGERDEGPADFPEWSLSHVSERLCRAQTAEVLDFPPRVSIYVKLEAIVALSRIDSMLAGY